jgi:hypothetical protein|mmetsp:Transcript_19802/g.25955  ORF Transcript_19802/g.25955 Transcript_19802/m.25955 type:complete len:90 (-) Transcript_19802:6-275(-)
MTDLTEHQLDELEDLIVQEKMQAALEHQNDVWASCVAEGIEPEILIDANMAMAIQESIRLHGEDATENLLNDLRDRILLGEFSPERTLQ